MFTGNNMVDHHPPNQRFRRMLGCMTVLLLFVAPMASSRVAAEDTLGDFEDAVEKAKDSGGESGGKRGKEEHHHHDDYDYDYDHDATEDDGVDAGVFLLLPLLILSTAEETLEYYSERRAGTPSAALVRLEGTYQRLNTGDVDGYTLRGELIWAFIGVGGEFISYREGSPKQSLDFTTIEGLFRVAVSEELRLTFAAGAMKIDGTSDTTRFEGGLSLGLYPTDWLGIEADLRWADLGGGTLGDYRVGGLVRLPQFPFLAVRGGYRTIRVGGDSLHGGEIGLVLTW